MSFKHSIVRHELCRVLCVSWVTYTRCVHELHTLLCVPWVTYTCVCAMTYIQSCACHELHTVLCLPWVTWVCQCIVVCSCGGGSLLEDCLCTEIAFLVFKKTKVGLSLRRFYRRDTSKTLSKHITDIKLKAQGRETDNWSTRKHVSLYLVWIIKRKPKACFF